MAANTLQMQPALAGGAARMPGVSERGITPAGRVRNPDVYPPESDL